MSWEQLRAGLCVPTRQHPAPSPAPHTEVSAFDFCWMFTHCVSSLGRGGFVGEVGRMLRSRLPPDLGFPGWLQAISFHVPLGARPGSGCTVMWTSALANQVAPRPTHIPLTWVLIPWEPSWAGSGLWTGLAQHLDVPQALHSSSRHVKREICTPSSQGSNPGHAKTTGRPGQLGHSPTHPLTHLFTQTSVLGPEITETRARGAVHSSAGCPCAGTPGKEASALLTKLLPRGIWGYAPW